jgi:hypothetical protein
MINVVLLRSLTKYWPSRQHRQQWTNIKEDYGTAKVFNSLPQSLKKATSNINKFKTALKRYLVTHSFYFIDDYFNVNKE